MDVACRHGSVPRTGKSNSAQILLDKFRYRRSAAKSDKFLWRFARVGGFSVRGGRVTRQREAAHARTHRGTLFGRCGLCRSSVAAAVAGNRPAYAQVGYDRPGDDYASASVPAAIPRCAQPVASATRRAGRGAFPIHGDGRPATCCLKREVVPRVGRAAACRACAAPAWSSRGWRSRIFDRPRRRRLPFVRDGGRSGRQSLRRRLPGRRPLPRLDLSAAAVTAPRRAAI